MYFISLGTFKYKLRLQAKQIHTIEIFSSWNAEKIDWKDITFPT